MPEPRRDLDGGRAAAGTAPPSGAEVPPRDATVRVLLLADTHIGFDAPRRPRVARRRRGPDFMACFEAALEPARAGEVDLVVHGGDLLYRSKVAACLVEQALLPLARIAEAGTPVFVVPGNHERSAIPRTLLTESANLHIFAEPRTVVLTLPRAQAGHDAGAAAGRTMRLAVAGFPFAREARRTFAGQLAATGCAATRADVRVLCVHATFEGAQVGPGNYTFRSGADIVPGRAVPAGFAAVLAGHIHRSQVLTRDLAGRPLAAPVVYPGSVERSSFAEEAEAKHFAIATCAAKRPGHGAADGGRLIDVRFCPLPARPMSTIVVDAAASESAALDALRRALRDATEDAVVRVRIPPAASPALRAALTAPRLRALAPPTMNVYVDSYAGAGPDDRPRR